MLMVGSKDCISSARNNISVLKEISEARHSENPMQLMNHSAASVSLKPSSILKSKAFPPFAFYSHIFHVSLLASSLLSSLPLPRFLSACTYSFPSNLSHIHLLCKDRVSGSFSDN